MTSVPGHMTCGVGHFQTLGGTSLGRPVVRVSAQGVENRMSLWMVGREKKLLDLVGTVEINDRGGREEGGGAIGEIYFCPQ